MVRSVVLFVAETEELRLIDFERDTPHRGNRPVVYVYVVYLQQHVYAPPR